MAPKGVTAGHTVQRRGKPARCQSFRDIVDAIDATRHQREVGTGYFDAVAEVLSGGKSSTTALADSTEADQFKSAKKQQAAE